METATIKRKVNAGVMLPLDVDEAYRREANARGISKSALMRMTLINHVDGHKNRMLPTTRITER